MTRLLNRARHMLSRGKVALKIFAFPDKYYIFDKKLYAHHQMSFSQEGEDMILSRLFEGKKTSGFYIDVGAHHPQRFSNTYRFYLRGWCGINIDPFPGGMSIFRDIRPRDINLEYAISDSEYELTYYEFNEPALNTFSPKLAEENNGLRGFKLVGERKIQTRRLRDVLAEHLPDGQNIDFLNVDVEGLDLQVLQSNNWEKYRPDIILVEDLNRLPLSQLVTSPVVGYLLEQGYILYAKAYNTLIFCKSDA